MKKIMTLIVVCLMFALPAIAAEAPVVDGADVLVPVSVIQAIPGFDGNTTVYAACNKNGWLRPGAATEKALAETVMVKEGKNYRALGMVGKRFHPAYKIDGQEPAWALLENVYNVYTDSNIDNTNPRGPCLKVR